jgi:heme/copper-type cytochrome/quinol oxidase subunit 2
MTTIHKTRWLASITAALVVVLLVLLLIGSQEPRTLPVAPITSPEPVEELFTGPRNVTVELRVHQGGYSPDSITVNRYDNVTLRVRSTDGKVHGLAIPIYGISERVEPGELVVVNFQATIAGTFEYYSDVASNPNSARIRGVLQVER